MRQNEELKTLAIQLDAMAKWQKATSTETDLADVLFRAAKWLRAASHKTCGQGMIGCSGGDDCKSDHK